MERDELRQKRTALKRASGKTLDNMQKVAEESARVAKVAHNARETIESLDREFELQTGLQGNDTKFLFAAVGLQLARIVILNECTKVEPAGKGNRIEEKLSELQKRLLENLRDGVDIVDRPYYASLEHIVAKKGVPYDATAPLSEDTIQRLKEKIKTWGFDPDIWIPKERLGLFRGGNHRFSTLGHDPILGLIFGTGNIMTNTITCVKSPIQLGTVEIPVLTTNHVIYTTDYTDPRIGIYGSTTVMLQKAAERAVDQPMAFIASLIKQILHIGTDLYTPCGIQIPGANLVLSTHNVEQLTQSISTGDLLKIGAAAKLAEFINMLIGALHGLMYDPSASGPRDIYGIRTRKILLYSNLIATSSNVIWVGANMNVGNENAAAQLDIGGLIITIGRLINDTEYIRQIKEEFVLGGFKKMIQGNSLNLEDA